MITKQFLLSQIGFAFLLASCVSEAVTEARETFKVVSPRNTDTVYHDEYVAEIAAVQNVEVRTRIKGFIQTIHVDEGKTVVKGQKLFSINSTQHEQELQKAIAVLKNAVAELKLTEIELENVKKLLEKNIVSKSEVSLLETKVDALKAKVEEAEAHKSQVENALSFTEIRAPFDGIINRIPNKTGSLVEEGELLTTISNTKEVFAYFNLSENDYLNYMTNGDESGSKMVNLVLVNDSVYEHKGKVETIESEFDQSTGNISFRARFPNPDAILKHGANGKIIVEKKLANALLVPQTSTFEIQDKLFVFVVNKDSVVEQRNIIPQMQIPHYYVIKSGVTSKDKIILEGVQNAKNGEKIIPQSGAF
jgi:RND family efflux transporter MFP subunit